MNIDINDLKPKTLKEFKQESGVKASKNGGGDGSAMSELIAQTRYEHFCKKRGQALAILKVRMEDLRNGEY